jgi:pyridoxine 4-dehydrogenase
MSPVVNGQAEKRVERRQLGPFAVSPVGFGAMQLAGPGVFGPPRDCDRAIRLLREVIDMGVDHIDTAQYYGPDVVNQLIGDALPPHTLVIPGTSSIAHLHENLAAMTVSLDADALALLAETQRDLT